MTESFLIHQSEPAAARTKALVRLERTRPESVSGKISGLNPVAARYRVGNGSQGQDSAYSSRRFLSLLYLPRNACKHTRGCFSKWFQVLPSLLCHGSNHDRRKRQGVVRA